MTKTIIYTMGEDLKAAQKQRETLINFAKTKNWKLLVTSLTLIKIKKA